MTSTSRTGSRTVTIAGYSHVNLTVVDLDAAIAFYTDVLGFEVLPRPDFGPQGRGVWLGHGAAQVHLAVVDGKEPRTGFLPHIALHVPADAYADTMAELEARGVEFLVSGIADVARLRTTWFVDPFGVVFILIEKSRPERPYYAQWSG